MPIVALSVLRPLSRTIFCKVARALEDRWLDATTTTTTTVAAAAAAGGGGGGGDVRVRRALVLRALAMLSRVCSLLIASLAVAVAAAAADVALPECEWIDPRESPAAWRQLDRSACNVSIFTPPATSAEHAVYERGFAAFSFNSYASDKIGPRREVPRTYNAV